MTNQELARQIIDKVGRDNIIKAFNCMTRLRLEVREVNVTKKDFTGMDGVKGVILSQSEVHLVLGPGKAGNVARELKALLAEESARGAVTEESSGTGKAAGASGMPGAPSADSQAEGKKSPASPQGGSKDTPAPDSGNGQSRISVTELAKKAKVGDGEALHQAIRAKNASRGKALLHKIAHLFIPLIPAFIACGLITGITSLAVKIDPSLAAQPFIQYLRVTGSVVFWVLNAFVGLYAAREFGGTPILGGVMAALLSAPGLAEITLFGAPLIPGRGGVFAAILAGAFTAFIEKQVRKRVPEMLELFLTPLLTVLIVAMAILFVIQPVGGILSDAIGQATIHAIRNGDAFTGFVLGGIFLPVVMAGIHHGIVPIHADMLSTIGMTLLLPIIAMAGCGQIGASVAVLLKTKNASLRQTILSALPVGLLGIGEPLIYGVTLPLGRPFLGACFGGACGGAWQAYQHIGAYAMGISGLPLAAATNDIPMYLAGLGIAYLGGFIATWIIGFDDPPEETEDAEEAA